MAAAFKSGLSNSASIQVYPDTTKNLSDLDTHSNHHPIHRASLTNVFEQIADLLKLFDSLEISPGVSLLSRTNIYIASEFSRTPALNNSQGKDHNAYTNSVLMMGPRIRGGQVIGGSRLISKKDSGEGISLHVGQYVNPSNGQVISKSSDLNQGILLKPETIAASLLVALGVQQTDLGSDLNQEPLLKVLMK
jgi:hypothetical protein